MLRLIKKIDLVSVVIELLLVNFGEFLANWNKLGAKINSSKCKKEKDLYSCCTRLSKINLLRYQSFAIIQKEFALRATENV